MFVGVELIISTESRHEQTKGVDSENSQLNRKPIREGRSGNKRISMIFPSMFQKCDG